jgi:hypothetical protein
MGIATPFARMLVEARGAGADFRRTLTIGRQSLGVPAGELQELLAGLGIAADAAREIARDPFAEPFLRRALGSERVESLDHSAYQGATILHDLNRPIPADWHGRYDALVDGGAIEHIFDVRQVLVNYMQLVRVGGHVFIAAPANNLFGHGFYQFSSDLFYRVFDAANGFTLRRMTVTEAPLSSVEASRHWRLYETRDPAEAGKRVRLVGRRPLLLNVHAERVADCVPFAQPPIQSSFEKSWGRRAEPAAGDGREPDAAPASDGFRYVGVFEELRRRVQDRRLRSLRNRRFFRPLGRLR